MRDDDVIYYRHRAAIETDLAHKAHQPEVVAAHTRLAALYFECAETGENPKLTSSE